jgi:hypothetical protein
MTYARCHGHAKPWPCAPPTKPGAIPMQSPGHDSRAMYLVWWMFAIGCKEWNGSIGYYFGRMCR